MKRTRTGGSYVYKGGRGQTLTLEPGRRGTLQVSGRAVFTPEEFRAWLNRAEWYVRDLMGSGTPGEPVLRGSETGDGIRLSRSPQLTLPLPGIELTGPLSETGAPGARA